MWEEEVEEEAGCSEPAEQTALLASLRASTCQRLHLRLGC